MVFLWSISNVCLVNIKIHFHFGCCSIHLREISYDCDVLLLSRIWSVIAFFCGWNHGILLCVIRPLFRVWVRDWVACYFPCAYTELIPAFDSHISTLEFFSTVAIIFSAVTIKAHGTCTATYVVIHWTKESSSNITLHNATISSSYVHIAVLTKCKSTALSST